MVPTQESTVADIKEVFNSSPWFQKVIRIINDRCKDVCERKAEVG